MADGLQRATSPIYGNFANLLMPVVPKSLPVSLPDSRLSIFYRDSSISLATKEKRKSSNARRHDVRWGDLLKVQVLLFVIKKIYMLLFWT